MCVCRCVCVCVCVCVGPRFSSHSIQHVAKKRRKGPSTTRGAIVTDDFLRQVREAEVERASKSAQKQDAARERELRAFERTAEAAQVAVAAEALLAAGQSCASLTLAQLHAIAKKHAIPLPAKSRKADICTTVAAALAQARVATS